MSFPTPANKLFTRDWIITVPSHPNVRFVRVTASLMDIYISILADKKNHPFASDGVKAKVWDEDALAKMKTASLTQYAASVTAQNNTTFLVELNGEYVGYGAATGYGSTVVGERKANVGLMFAPEARGMGIGKLALRLLLRLSNEIQVDVVRMGTMANNLPMRALAKSLGLEETAEVVSFPGVGVVNEVVYKGIKKGDFKDFNFDIEFLSSGPADLTEI